MRQGGGWEASSVVGGRTLRLEDVVMYPEEIGKILEEAGKKGQGRDN